MCTRSGVRDNVLTPAHNSLTMRCWPRYLLSSKFPNLYVQTEDGDYLTTHIILFYIIMKTLYPAFFFLDFLGFLFVCLFVFSMA